MGCLYFIPARRFPGERVPDVIKPQRMTPEGALSLDDVGLSHLDGAGLNYRSVRGAGPDGGAGLVVSLRTPANETGHFPESQTWQPVDGGALFIGWPTDAKPGPDVFLRKDALPGTSPVTMADGNEWAFVPSAALPEVMKYNGAGEVVFMPRAQDTAHFASSDWLMTYSMEGGTRSFTEIVGHVVTCLQARYHISVYEFLALGLFSTDLNTRIVLATLGLDFDEVVHGKKNEALTAFDLNSGLADDSAA